MRWNVRKAEVAHVCDRGNRRAVKCDVTQRGVVECFIAIPVHSKYGGMSLRGAFSEMVEEGDKGNLHQASCS